MSRFNPSNSNKVGNKGFVYPESLKLAADADDTASIQRAIDKAQETGDELRLAGNKRYRVSNSLVISKPMIASGGGCYETFRNTDRPGDPPFLEGTVIEMTASNKDVLIVTVSARSVNLKDFGIEFKNHFVNTGHGIYGLPPIEGSGYDHGIFSSSWESIKVAGHDGNHYAFYIINPLYNTFSNLRSYGGGVICLDNNSNPGNWHYGNTVLMHPYGIMMQGGTAAAYRLKSTTDKLNMVTMIRPQVNVIHMLPGLGGISPTDQQHPVHADHNTANCTIIDGDFESGIGELENWYGQMGWDVNSGGYLGYVRDPFTQYVPQSGHTNKNEMGKDGHMLGKVTMNPTSTKAATLTIAIGPDTTPDFTTTILEMSIPAGAPIGQVFPYSFCVRAGWCYTITVTNGELGTLRNTNQRGWGLGRSG